MPDPLALCIEDVDATSVDATSRDEQYTQCVALVGRQPGLRLDEAGRVTWLGESTGGPAGAVACELWVSADDRLILYRPKGAVPVTVRRAGRSLEAPFAKPVVLLDKDEVDIGTRHFRLHIHGKAPAITAPKPLKVPESSMGRLAKSAAAAAALMTAATACIDVRLTPPEAPALTDTPTIDVRDFPPDMAEPMETPTIDVRETPPMAIPPIVAPEGSIAHIFLEPWSLTQVYDVGDEQVLVIGTLYFGPGTYWVSLQPNDKRPQTPGALDFLIDNVSGEVSMVYAEGIDPTAALANFAPGTLLATADFYANSEHLGSLLVKAGEDGAYFADLSGESDSWRITQ